MRERGGKEGRRERGMSVICVRGKRAESPVRGKFTLVWWGAEVEERQSWCSGGQSVVGGGAETACTADREKEEEEEEALP